MFHTSKAIVAAIQAAQATRIRGVLQPKNVKNTTLSVKVKVPRGFPLSIPQLLDEPGAFKIRKPEQRGKFDDLCNRVVELKKKGSIDYQSSKLIGDSQLRSTVYCIIKRYDRSMDIKTTADPILENTGVMTQFFDKHLAVKHDLALPNESGNISDHGKSDVVEALLELARSERDTFAFMFIIEELFVMANMGKLVGK